MASKNVRVIQTNLLSQQLIPFHVKIALQLAWLVYQLLHAQPVLLGILLILLSANLACLFAKLAHLLLHVSHALALLSLWYHLYASVLQTCSLISGQKHVKLALILILQIVFNANIKLHMILIVLQMWYANYLN